MENLVSKHEYLAAKRSQLLRMEGQLQEIQVVLEKISRDSDVIRKTHRTQNAALMANLDDLGVNIKTLYIQALVRVERTNALISAMKFDLFLEHGKKSFKEDGSESDV